MSIALERESVVPARPATSRCAQRIDSAAEFAAMAEEWNELAGDIPFRRWEWLEAWWRHYALPGDELCLLAVRDPDGALCGLAPWYLSHEKWGERVVRFLGSGAACSEYLAVFHRPDREAEVASAVATWLSDSRGRDWHTLELHDIDPHDRVLARLVDELVRRGHLARTSQSVTTWQIQLPGTWDQLLAGLSSKRRNHVRSLCRRQLDSGHAVLHTVEHPHQLAQKLDELSALSCQRHRGEEGSSFECPRFRGFLREVAERFLPSGRLEFHWLEVEGQTAALECGFADRDTAYGYQIALDPAHAQEEPGWVILAAKLQQAIERGRKTFDLLRGSEHYKASWRATPREMVSLRIAARTPLARSYDLRWAARQHARSAAKRCLARLGLRNYPAIFASQRIRRFSDGARNLPVQNPQPFTVECIADAAQLAKLRECWNALAGPIPFRQWDWLEAWWLHFQQPGDQLRVLIVRDQNKAIVGLAPWFVRSSKTLGQVIQFLGAGKVASDYATVLCAARQEQGVAQCLAQWLASEQSGRWHALELSGVDREDVAVRHLLRALRETGHAVDERAGLSCWRVDLPEQWDSYVATLSKSRRERVRQLCRRQFGAGRAVTQVVQRPDQLAPAMEMLRDLHTRRRHSLGEVGCFSCPRFSGFLHEVARRYLDQGQLRLQWTELEGRPVAAEFDLIGGDTMYYYQSGVDPDSIDERPGWLSTIGALQAAVQQGLRTYDFLRGDYAFKSNWRGVSRPLVEIRIVPRKPAAQLRRLVWHARQTLKQSAKWLLQAARLRRQPEAPHTPG